MILLLNKIFVVMLFVTFSSVWVSDQFVVLSNEKKYDFYEQSEKNAEENNPENKTKTLFLVLIENSNNLVYSKFKNKHVNSADQFRVKESDLKNATPPPKNGYLF